MDSGGAFGQLNNFRARGLLVTTAQVVILQRDGDTELYAVRNYNNTAWELHTRVISGKRLLERYYLSLSDLQVKSLAAISYAATRWNMGLLALFILLIVAEILFAWEFTRLKRQMRNVEKVLIYLMAQETQQHPQTLERKLNQLHDLRNK